MKKWLLFFSLLASFVAHAFEPAQVEALDKRLNTLKQQTLAGNSSITVEMMPPAFFQSMSAQFNIPVEQLKQQLLQQATQYTAQVQLQDYQYDLTHLKLTRTETNRIYGFVPTELMLRSNGQNAQLKGHLFAVQENGEWYFLNWNPQYTETILKMYPDIHLLSPPTP